MDYDIAIIGLGPAGSTLARLLSPSFKVIALDKKHEVGNEGFHKPCGGLLANDAQKAFIRQKLNLPKDILTDPQIFSVKTIDLQTKIVRNYQRSYVSFDRHKFDLWLKSLIPATVTVLHNTLCKEVRRIIDGYQITYIDKNKTEHNITTQYVVGADGANSLVRRMRYPNHTIRQYVAIQQWFTEQHPDPFYSCIFDNKSTNCYAWSISKDGYFIFGGAFPKKLANQNFEKLKEKLSTQGFIFGESIKTEKCLAVYPNRFRDFYTGNENIFLIGEAAGFISASSLEGISYALDSAEILSKILNSGKPNPNKRYYQNTIPLRLKLYSKIVKAKILTTPLWRKLIMKSKIQHTKQIE
ncbi:MULTISPECIES: FAD-binding protein [unclassified Gilliamella]|uniref:FAD-binding protein n=1 Tax=unclassified Gilliamella TaxID=2685620 RepID=UPI00132B0772|nr:MULTISPECIES: FAD-binding protein [unclassified Gilliamella]MWN31973.1 FAD-binding protein [Gilliamella sp. Pra-s60]MWP29232.1 FAD-binding protein [Gilliamella sp. Pra-s54]